VAGFILCLALNLAPGPVRAPAGGVAGHPTPAIHPASATAHLASPCLSFHHLHLNDSRPSSLLEFYERLFDPATTRRVTVGGADGLQSGPMLILIGRGSSAREQVTALWHFGWGAVSLGETYLAHARREVAWEPPLPAGRLHLHVRSVTPRAAAAWYRDVLGARVEFPAQAGRAGEELPLPEHRIPEALVWLGETGLLIYRTEPPLLSTRGQRIDHVAIACADLDAALIELSRRGTTVMAGPAAVGDLRTAMIEGPDRMALELVEGAARPSLAR
jgi:lactoylglutathione lyase